MKAAKASHPGALVVATQLSLLAEVPERTLVHRGHRPAVKPDVERALVTLTPQLPSNMLPAFHKGCVEIAVPAKHAVEKLLRKVGFKPNRHPFGWVKPEKVKGTRKPKPVKQTAIAEPPVALRYWRLEFAR